MERMIKKLGLNSISRASRNVWLTALFIFVLLGMNYSKLLIPESAFVAILSGLSLFGYISLIATAYLVKKEWSTMTGDERIKKILYLGLITSVTILVSFLPIKILTLFLR